MYLRVSSSIYLMYFCFSGFSFGDLYFLWSCGTTPTEALEDNAGNCLLTNGNAIGLKVPASKTYTSILLL